MNFKIKISCIRNDELLHNNKQISIKNYNKYDKYELDKLFNNFNYIKKSFILYKKLIGNKFITKTLEFLCNNEITDDDFKLFIKNMHDVGFYSKDDTEIKFVKNIYI